MSHLPLGSLSRGRGALAVPGMRLGHAGRTSDGALTGTTVLVPPPGSVAAVDVRGGGPAGHETDVIRPGTHPYGADALVLTGGSAFGLVTAHGVQRGLMEDGAGFPAPGLPGVTVPIVPASAVFDLGRGGVPFAPPQEEDGYRAYRDAREDQPGLRGSVGAGLGAWTGRGVLRGGLGQAVLRTPNGYTVTATVVVNAMGSAVDRFGNFLAAGVLAGYGWELPRIPAVTERWANLDARADGTAADVPASPRNTTIACVTTDAALDTAQAERLAGSAHAGLARALHPSHTLYDGDTVYALATASAPVAREALPTVLVELNIAAADVLSAAIVDAVMSADASPVPAPVPLSPPAVRDLAPDIAEAWDRGA
ncbi:P1 family peptidase [Brevibacterium samyangense]|uniref:P1 family peptidase n=1 Tax=Brevibacterium samyangense TaxID=366888 RepID=A0ABN2T991_9MICO